MCGGYPADLPRIFRWDDHVLSTNRSGRAVASALSGVRPATLQTHGPRCLFPYFPILSPITQILPRFPTMLTKFVHSRVATKRLCILQTGPATRRLCPQGCNFGTHKRNCTWWNEICVSSFALFCFVLHCCIVFAIPILFQKFKIGIILTTLCLDKLSYWTVGNTGRR